MIALFVGLITFSQVGRPALRDSCKIARFIVRFIFHCEIHFLLWDSFLYGRAASNSVGRPSEIHLFWEHMPQEKSKIEVFAVDLLLEEEGLVALSDLQPRTGRFPKSHLSKETLILRICEVYLLRCRHSCDVFVRFASSDGRVGGARQGWRRLPRAPLQAQ